MPRFRVVTKHQVSGWRFLLRRIEHALVRRDASMIDDPQRGRATALAVGVTLACVIVAGAAVLAFFRPDRKVGDTRLVAEKETGALYVRVGERLHPALNLTSARLIIGAPESPVSVARSELARYPRGPWVGIPGAPGALADSGDADSSWAVCDAPRTGMAAPIDAATGLPTLAHSAVRTTVIGGPLSPADAGMREPAIGEARLLRADGTTWLVYRDGDNGTVRAAIDLADSPVVLALGIDSAAPVLPVSKGLINAVTEVPPIRVPEVPGAGATVTLASGLNVRVGSVLVVSATDPETANYLVTESGLVRVNPVVAAMIRYTNAQGSVSGVPVGPDVVAAGLRPGALPGTASYPDRPVRLVDPIGSPVTCQHWSRGGGAGDARVSLLVGRQLPLASTEQSRPVELVTAVGSGGRTADAAYLPRDTGSFVQVTGSDPGSPRRESLFWISDSGVRYGIDAERTGTGSDPTLTALGLRSPVLAPWSIVSLFAPGPTLSQRDARVQHDGISSNASGAELGTPR
ncbi:type VII secretion protein EccB [Nocardia brasiliensis]|uniref:type VII secretion protein EccB n=1 Tax=Nocardia brasiliensis TaxID=37326 RepID=UPI0024579117|nr:type VII secretion protein EccB [Nocardia brasiliensis]